MPSRKRNGKHECSPRRRGRVQCFVGRQPTEEPRAHGTSDPMKWHQFVASPRVSRFVLAAVWGSGGSPGAKLVAASGGKPGPLGGRAAVQPHLVTFGIPPLRQGQTLTGAARP